MAFLVFFFQSAVYCVFTQSVASVADGAVDKILHEFLHVRWKGLYGLSALRVNTPDNILPPRHCYRRTSDWVWGFSLCGPVRGSRKAADSVQDFRVWQILVLLKDGSPRGNELLGKEKNPSSVTSFPRVPFVSPTCVSVAAVVEISALLSDIKSLDHAAANWFF